MYEQSDKFVRKMILDAMTVYRDSGSYERHRYGSIDSWGLGI